MQNEMLLSVIVPVYNCEKYLRTCIESILSQSYGSLEVILVDDGSTDTSGQICDEFSGKNEKIKVIHKQNEGACFARRDGIMAASAEYITFVDGDDWIEPEMYQVLMKYLMQNDADIVTSGSIRNEAGERVFDLISEGVYEGESKEKICNEMLYNRQYNTVSIMMTLWNKIYRKSLMIPFILQLPPNLYLWEDITYVYPPFTKAKKIVITHELFYHYRENEASVSKKYDPLEYEKTAYTMRVAREVYQKLGRNILEAFDLECCQIYYRYMWTSICEAERKNTKLKDLKKRLKAVLQDVTLKNSLNNVISIIPLRTEKKFLQLMLNDKICKAIVYCKISYCRQKITEWTLQRAHQLLGESNICKIKRMLGKE